MQQYEAHMGMITKILGRQGLFNGMGTDAFVRASTNFTPERGVKFSTYLYHNLVLQKKIETGRVMKMPAPENFIPIEDAYWVDGVPQPQQIAEFRDDLNSLPADAKTLVALVLGGKNSKRMIWPEGIAGTRREIRAELKTYCLEKLGWDSPRYYTALNKIKEVLR